jgi:hypothetical protein
LIRCAIVHNQGHSTLFRYCLYKLIEVRQPRKCDVCSAHSSVRHVHRERAEKLVPVRGGTGIAVPETSNVVMTSALCDPSGQRQREADHGQGRGRYLRTPQSAPLRSWCCTRLGRVGTASGLGCDRGMRTRVHLAKRGWFESTFCKCRYLLRGSSRGVPAASPRRWRRPVGVDAGNGARLWENAR